MYGLSPFGVVPYGIGLVLNETPTPEAERTVVGVAYPRAVDGTLYGVRGAPG